MRIRFSVIGAAFLVFLGCQARHGYPTPRPVAFHPIEILQPTQSTTPGFSAAQTPAARTLLEWPVSTETVFPEDVWQMITANRTYLIPVVASFDPSETLRVSYVLNDDGRPLAVFTSHVRKIGHGAVGIGWRILDAREIDGRVVIHALEGADFEFANCPHYEVSSFNRSTSLVFEGEFSGIRISATAERDYPFYRCAPARSIRPPDGYYLADAAFAPDGTIWALFDSTKYEGVHRLLPGHYRSDGTLIWLASEPVPFAIWNFVTTDGLVCGIRADVPVERTTDLESGHEEPCWNLKQKDTGPMRYSRLQFPVRAADIVKLFQ